MTVTSIGTPSTQTSPASGSPKLQAGAWGTGQDRATGDLLVAVVTASGSTSAGTITENTAFGWSKVCETTNAYAKTAIFTKTAALDATPPTFQSTIAGTSARCGTSVKIYQLHSSTGYTPAVDVSGTGTGTGTVSATTSPGVVAAANEYAIAGQALQGSSTGTNTWGAVGSWTANNDGLSAYYHFVHAYLANPASGSALVYNPTHTATASGVGAAIAVFKDGSAPITSPPQLVQYAETAWNGTGATSTPSISWEAGDIILAIGGTETYNSTMPVPTATGLTFVAHTAVPSGTVCWANSWIATPSAPGSSAVSVSNSQNLHYGLGVWVFRASSGMGARATSNTSAKTATLARTQNHSMVIMGSFDYSAGAITSYSWVPAPVGNDRQHAVEAGAYTVYVADWADQGNSGSTAYGTSGESSTGPFANVIIEILGGAGAPAKELSGDVKLKKMSVDASGEGIAVITNGPRLKKMQVAASGAGISAVTAAPRMKKMTVSAAGAGISVVTSAPNMKKMRIAASGTKVSDVSGNVRLKKMTVAGSLTKVAPAPSISGDLRLKKMTLAGAGTGISVSTGTPRMKKMTVTGTGAGITVVTSAPRMKKMTVSGASAGITVVTSAPRMKKMTVSGTMSKPGMATFSGDIRMKKMRTSVTGAGIAVVTATPRMKKMTVAGSGTAISVGTAAVRMKKMRVQIDSTPLKTVSGDVRMKKMRAAATGAGFADVISGPSMHKMRIAGTGTAITVVTGDVRMKKMRPAGAGVGISTGIATVSMKKPRIAGTGAGISVITANVKMSKMIVHAETEPVPSSPMFVYSLL